jgi:hypothetical protein
VNADWGETRLACLSFFFFFFFSGHGVSWRIRASVAYSAGTRKDVAGARETDAQTRRDFRLFRYLAQTLTGCRWRTGLMVLDDLQWADELTLGLLAFRGKNWAVRSGTIVVLGNPTARRHQRSLGACHESVKAEEVLQGLEAGAVAEAAICSVCRQFQNFSNGRWVSTAHDGNPFFVAEYCGSRWRMGFCRETSADGGRSQATAAGRVDGAAVAPDPCGDLVGRRLSSLPPLERCAGSSGVGVGKKSSGGCSSGSGAAINRIPRCDGRSASGDPKVLEETEGRAPRFVHDQLRWWYGGNRMEGRRSAHRKERGRPSDGRWSCARAPSGGSWARHWEEASGDNARPGLLPAGSRREQAVYAHSGRKSLPLRYCESSMSPASKGRGPSGDGG